MAGIKFDITGDNSNMLSALQGVQSGVRQTARAVEQSGMTIEQVFKKLGNAASLAVTGMSLQNLSKQIATTRGEFQQLEIAFTTMLGSADKANTLMQQLTKTAATTPFDLQGVANGAKQLLAYGTQAEDVNSTLVKLGDIAAGLSLNLQDLVWLYGTTMTQGRMFTMDLRQFQSRGIPMAEAIASVLDTTKDKVADLVSAGKVTSDVVKKAIDSMATGSGKFAGLMEAQSKSITGQLSNIGDAYDMMLNEIGQSTEGVINTALSSVSFLLDNYEKIGSVILGVAAAFGEYKASLMIVAAVQQTIAKQRDLIETTRQGGLTEIAGNYTTSEQTMQENASNAANTASTEANTIARNANRSAVDAQIAAIQTKLQADLAEKTSAAETAAQALLMAQNRKREADSSVESWQSMYEAAIEAGDTIKAETLEEKLNIAASNQNAAAKELNTAQTNMRTAAVQRETAATRLSSFQTQVDTVNKTANTAATGILAAVTRSATAAFNSLKAAMASNPFTFILMGITTLISLLPLFQSETDKATDAQKRLRESMSADQGKLTGYLAVLENCSRSSKSYEDAVRGVNEIAKQYHTTQIKGADAYEQQRKACDELTEAIKRQATEKILADSASESAKKNIETEKEAIEELVSDANSTFHTSGKEGQGAFGVFAMEMYSLQSISKDMWATISADVISKSDEIGRAFSKSQQDGEAMVQKQTTHIKSMLSTMGASQTDLEYFTGAIENYIRTCGQSFSENNSELERTKKQLGALQTATIDLGDITSKNIKTYNYEQLRDAAVKVQEKIDTLNSTTTSPKVDDTQLQNLKALLQEINNLMPTTLTSGSNSDLSKRLQEAKATRDAAEYGSKEYKDANELVGTLDKELKKRQAGFAENETKNTKKEESDAKKALNERKKRIKEQQKYEETVRKQELAASRKAIDNHYDLVQAEIENMQDGSAKTIRQMQLDSERKLEELKREYEDLKQQKIENARALFEANPANEGKVFDASKVDNSYTEDEEDTYKQKRMAIQKQLQEDLKAQSDSEEQAMLTYLQMYGTFQEQKLAIAREYAKKIQDVQASSDSEESKRWQIDSLRKEQQGKVDDVEAKAITTKVDWYSVFDNVGLVMKSQLEPLLADLKKFVGTDKFKGLGADQQKAIVDAMANIRSQIGTSDVGFKDLAADITEYQKALQALRLAETEYNAALNSYSGKLQAAQANLDKAKARGIQASITKAQEEVDKYAGLIAASGQSYQQATDNVNTSGRKLQQTAKDVIKPMSEIGTFLSSSGLSQLSELWNSFEELKGGIDGLKALSEAKKAADDLKNAGKDISDATKNAAEDVSNVGNKVGDTFAEGLSKAGLIGQIVSAVLKILDILKDGIGTLISSLIDTVLGAIDGILKNILSGKFIEQIGSSLISGIGGILDTVTGAIGSVLSFGLLSSDGISSWFTNSNAKEVAETTERLTKENERLRSSVDNLKDEMSNQGGKKAFETYDSAVKNQQRINENQMEVLKAQMSYHNAHHSNAYYWGLGQTEYAELNRLLAEYSSKNPNDKNVTQRSVYSLDDIYKLTPEQMAYIRTYNVDLWNTMLEQGKYDKSEYWDAYADLAGELEDIADSFKESITQISFDSMRSNFISDLMDMEKEASDFSSDFSEMLAKAMLNAAISNLLEDELKKFYDDWAKTMQDREEAGMEMTEQDIAEYRRRWESLVQQGIDKRDEIAMLTGYQSTYTQEASSKGYSTMSQDTGEELNGRFTAFQISNENISQQANTISATVLSILTYSMVSSQGITEIRNMMIAANSYLGDIAKYVKLQYNEFGAKLDSIVSNTKKL